MLVREIRYLVYRELLHEWRRRYALGGVLLYMGSSIFIGHIVFNMRGGVLNVFSWNALFWIIMLFAAVNTIAKSFIQESPGRQLYFYTLTSAEGLILSKMLYNSFMMVLLTVLGSLFYVLLMGNPVRDPALFSMILLTGSLAFASIFTLISGIASKTEQSAMLMAVLGFPVVIPVLLLLIRLSGKAIEGASRAGLIKDWMGLWAIIVIAVTTSILLFPYLWRSN